MVKYTVTGLAELAKCFRDKAFDCERRADLTTGQARKALKSEAYAWNSAADITEATTIQPS